MMCFYLLIIAMLYAYGITLRGTRRILVEEPSATAMVWPAIRLPPSPMRMRGCVSLIAFPQMTCSWMSHYCEQKFQTQNYYFKESVCSGPTAEPIPGKNYTCCTADVRDEL